MAGIFLPGSSKGASGDITAVVAGDGLSGGATDGSASIALDLNGLTGATVAVANDSIPIIDANDSNASRKESIADLVSGIAGTNISASSGQLSVADSAAGTKGIVIVAGNAPASVGYSSGTATISIADSASGTKGAVIVAGGDGASVSYSSGTATVAVDLGTNSGLEIDSNKLQIAKGISQHDVAQFAASVADDDFLRIDGTTVEGLSAAEVAAAIEGNIDAVGTIATGTWEATDVAVAHGGTGASTLTANGVLIGNGTSAVTSVAMATKGHILIGDGSGNPQMLAVGSNDQVLTADSGETTGVKWAAAGGGGGTMTVVAKEALAAGAPVALVNDSGTIKAENIQGFGNDLSDPTDDNNIYGLQGRWYGSTSLVSCGSAGLAFVWTSVSSDTLTNYYAYVTVGTYSTTTRQIEWAAPTAVTSASAYPVRGVWDSNTERLLVVYSISGAVSKGIVYAISGGNVVTTGGTAPGTAASVNIQTHGEISFDLVFDDTNNTVHMAAEDAADSGYLKMTMLTVTGGTTNTVAITIAKTKVNGANITTGALTLRWGNARACLAYMDAGDSQYTKALIVTHDNSSCTWGSIIEPFGADQSVSFKNSQGGTHIAFDSSNNNWVIAGIWGDADSDEVLRVVAASNDLGTLGTPVTYDGVPSYMRPENVNTATGDTIATFSAFDYLVSMVVEYDPDRNCVVIVSQIKTGGDDFAFLDTEYRMWGFEKGSSSGSFAIEYAVTYLTLGGTDDVVLTKGDMKVHHTVNRHLPLASAIAIDYNSYGLAGTYDTQNNRLFTMCGTDNIILKRPNSSTDTAIADWFCYAMEGSDASGNYAPYSTSNMGKFIGFNTSAVSAAATATITVTGGINENQSNLTVGQEYWIGDSGTLLTQPPRYSMHLYKAGIATASTKLLVQNVDDGWGDSR